MTPGRNKGYEVPAFPIPPTRLPYGDTSTVPAVIEVDGLIKRYGDFTAVHGLSFVVQSGQVLGLVGPNGAGKTSTLRCLAGIIPPNAGTIRIAGIELKADPVAAKRCLA